MQPLPQTIEALRELARQGEVSLGVELYAMARRVRGVVPELVGLSLGGIEDGVPLTLVASTEQLAALDAVQYLDGGPCVAAVDRAEPLDVNVGDLLDEDRRRLYARASAPIGGAQRRDRGGRQPVPADHGRRPRRGRSQPLRLHRGRLHRPTGKGSGGRWVGPCAGGGQRRPIPLDCQARDGSTHPHSRGRRYQSRAASSPKAKASTSP